MNAVVSVVLFDQNLDQKLTWAGLGWPGPKLGWPKSSPGLGPGQFFFLTKESESDIYNLKFLTKDVESDIDGLTLAQPRA